MITYTSNNLFDTVAQTLVNPVNTVGVMGKGLALAFKNRYPEMFEQYKALCAHELLTTGKLWLYRPEAAKWVLNFPTKRHWRDPSQLEWIEAGLDKFLSKFEELGIVSISFPRLGTGNGGLDWRVVQPVMEKALKDLPIPVYIHTGR